MSLELQTTSQVKLELQQELAEMNAYFEANHPEMKSALRNIHRIIRNDPEQQTLLNDDEIAAICKVQIKLTGASIGAKEAKKKPTKALKHTSVDDL